jgi:hypothetical protein
MREKNQWSKTKSEPLALPLQEEQPQQDPLAQVEISTNTDGSGLQSDLPESDLLFYSKATLVYCGPHDSARRIWLRNWGKERHYPKEYFTLYSRSSGYYQACLPEGLEWWNSFLDKQAPFEIYCLFASCYASSTCASGQERMELLPHCLNDASQRGEIHLGSPLLWTSQDKKKAKSEP